MLIELSQNNRDENGAKTLDSTAFSLSIYSTFGNNDAPMKLGSQETTRGIRIW